MARLLGALAAIGAADALRTKTGENPVQKVVTLLKDIMNEKELQIKNVNFLSKKTQCWAANTSDELKKEITTGEGDVKRYTSAAESAKGSIGELTISVKQTQDDIEKTQTTLNSAEGKRIEDRTSYNKQDGDFTTQIGGLEAAILVLQKHQSNGFLQVRKVIDTASATYPERAALQEAKAVLAQLTQPGTTGNMAYSSQSGEIFGILSQLLEDMKADHTNLQENEKDTVKNFTDLKKTLETKLQTLNEKLVKDNIAKSDAEVALAEASQAKELAAKKLVADRDMLATVEEKAAADLAEATLQRKSHNEELTVIQQVLDILTSKESSLHFGGTQFLQVKSTTTSKRSNSKLTYRQKSARAMAATVLKQTGSTKLKLLAASMTKLDAFGEIYKKIDQLIVDLGKSKDDEVSKNDACMADLHENEQTQEKTEYKKKTLEDKAAELTEVIARLEQEISELNEEYADADIAMAGMTNDRVDQAKDFAKVYSDNEITQRILGEAKFRMKQFYGFIQQPEEQLEKGAYKKSGSGQGVIQLLDNIMADSAGEAKAAKANEQRQQKEYEEFIANHREYQKTTNEQIALSMSEKADNDKALATTEKNLKLTLDELQDLGKVNVAMHADCDFLLNNFQTRQEGFVSEIEGLKQAKQILQGASTEAGR